MHNYRLCYNRQQMPKTKKSFRFLLMLIRRDVHALEYDPAVQYKFHFNATWFWLIAMFAAPLVPALRDTWLGLLILEASLWANFATHFSGMSSALAAQNKDVDNPVASEFEY